MILGPHSDLGEFTEGAVDCNHEFKPGFLDREFDSVDVWELRGYEHQVLAGIEVSTACPE